MTLPWYEIPQLNYPRSSCGTLVYNNKLFILYGEGSVDIPNRKKKAVELLGDVNQLEYADLDDLMTFKSRAKADKMAKKEMVKNPWKVLGVESEVNVSF